MKFVNRETQYPGKRKLIKVDPNNVSLGKDPILVNIIKDEGIVTVEGTPTTAENLNKGNWRDDDSLSFMMLEDNDLPGAEAEVTQMVTTANGETWIIPPAGSGQAAFNVVNSVGTTIKINGSVQQDLNFSSDPQTQITTTKNTADAANGLAGAAQGTANSKSIVNVNGIKADLNFTSDPQAQINGKADKVVTITTHEQLYRKDANGTQGMRDASSSVVNEAIPIRQSNGHISVPVTPSANTDAASKQYVDNRLSEARKWIPMYEIGDIPWNQNVGLRCDGVNTNAFVNSAYPILDDGSVFRVYMRDYRNNRSHSVDEISFRYDSHAYTSVFHAESDGTAYNIRTFFIRSNDKVTVHIRQHAADVTSAGNREWYNDGDYRRIVRIEKEVPL